MMESGLMVLSTATVSGKAPLVIVISASGSRTRLMVMASTNGPTAISTRVNGNFASVMAKAPTLFRMVTCTWENTTMARLTATDSTDGLTVIPILESSSRG